MNCYKVLFFQLATLRGNEPLVKLLLKNNADANYKNKVNSVATIHLTSMCFTAVWKNCS